MWKTALSGMRPLLWADPLQYFVPMAQPAASTSEARPDRNRSGAASAPARASGSRSRVGLFVLIQILIMAWLVACALVWDNAWIQWPMKRASLVGSFVLILIIEEWACFRVLRWNAGGQVRGRAFSHDQGGGGVE